VRPTALRAHVLIVTPRPKLTAPFVPKLTRVRHRTSPPRARARARARAEPVRGRRRAERGGAESTGRAAAATERRRTAAAAKRRGRLGRAESTEPTERHGARARVTPRAIAIARPPRRAGDRASDRSSDGL